MPRGNCVTAAFSSWTLIITTLFDALSLQLCSGVMRRHLIRKAPGELNFCVFWTVGNGDSSVVRVPGSWSKGCRFETQQENFLLQCQLPVLCHCQYLFRHPFHPHVTTVARKRPGSIWQKCRLQLNTHAPYICSFACEWHDMVHGCMVYTVRTGMAAVSHGTSHATTKQRCMYTTSLDIQNAIKS